jgi:hypothetical protein
LTRLFPGTSADEVPPKKQQIFGSAHLDCVVGWGERFEGIFIAVLLDQEVDMAAIILPVDDQAAQENVPLDGMTGLSSEL